jgi:glycerol-3-phosphate cytidylyltransferase
MTDKGLIGYTAGAFDLLHIGHLNLIKRSKECCDYLIVGVTTDELIQRTKNRKPIIPFSERFEIVSSIKYVDETVVQDDLDKVLAWKKYHYDKLFSGDDWKNDKRWIGYETELSKVGVDVTYFPYTKSTSSTIIQNILYKTYMEK